MRVSKVLIVAAGLALSTSAYAGGMMGGGTGGGIGGGMGGGMGGGSYRGMGGGAYGGMGGGAYGGRGGGAYGDRQTTPNNVPSSEAGASGENADRGTTGPQSERRKEERVNREGAESNGTDRGR